MDVQQLLPSLLMETGTRYSSIQRSTSTYDLCLLRTTVIDCCTPVPGLASGLAATSTPPLFFFFFFPPYLVPSVPFLFYSPSSTRQSPIRSYPTRCSSYWRFKSLRNCVRQRERERERGEKPVESLKRERRYESTAVSRNERRRIGKPDAVGATTLDADDSQTLSSQLLDDSCDNKRGTRVSEPEGAPLRLSFSKLRKPINFRPFFPLINFLPARRGRERK